MKKSFLKIALCLPLLTACTKDSLDIADSSYYTNPEALSLNLDASQLASRLVITGKKENRSGIRNLTEAPPPSIPVPSDSKTMPDYEKLKNGKYKVDNNFVGKIICDDEISTSIYITGNMTVTGIEGNPKELCIYVLQGAKLTWNIKDYFGFVEYPDKNLVIKSWGEITTEIRDCKGLKINKKTSLCIVNQNGGFFETGELRIEGKMTSFEPVRVKGKAVFSNGAKVNFYADSEFEGNSSIKDYAIEIIEKSDIYLGGCTHVGGVASKFGQDNDMKIDNESILKVKKYMSVNGVVYISNKSTLKLLYENSIFFNSQDMYIDESSSSMLTGGHVYVGALCVKDADMRDEIKNINLYTDELKKGYDKYSPTLSWTELLLGGEKNFIYKGEYEVPTCSAIGTETPQLEEVAQILPPYRDLKYSATSIDFNGNQAYISWHTNPKHAEKDFGGVIDIVNIQKNTFEASLTNSLVKYNHVLWDNGTMYIAGESEAKGALLCRIEMSSEGLFPTPATERVITLNGRSTNCVAALDENYLITASSGNMGKQGGFNIFNKNTIRLDETSFFIQAEKAKYVYKKNNELLTFNDMNKGQVKLYDYNSSNDLSSLLDKPKRIFNAGKISPENGKNVSMFDEQYIYVCMGENGLKIYKRDGWPLGVYGIRQVNGVDSDEKYIYLAHGYGVSIIDKHTGRIMTTKGCKGASANFIRKGNDGRIYVAYGNSGLRVFSIKQ